MREELIAGGAAQRSGEHEKTALQRLRVAILHGPNGRRKNSGGPAPFAELPKRCCCCCAPLISGLQKGLR